MRHDCSVTRLIGLSAVFIVAPAVHAAEQPCQELKHRTAPQFIEYLRGERATLRPACIEFAIDALSKEGYPPGAEVLVSYLDFKSLKQADMWTPLLWKWEYPAAQALFLIGTSATDSLVRAIAGADSSEVLRTNAEDVLLLINRDDPKNAIRILRQRSRSARDAGTAARLFESAISLARRCPHDHYCELALSDR